MKEKVPVCRQAGFASILILVIVLVTAGVIGGAYYLGSNNNTVLPQPVSPTSAPIQKDCTQEAKLCPDRSSVGRTGPNCEFTPCPVSSSAKTSDETANWKTYENNKYCYSFQYPENWELDRKMDENSGNANVSDLAGRSYISFQNQQQGHGCNGGGGLSIPITIEDRNLELEDSCISDLFEFSATDSEKNAIWITFSFPVKNNENDIMVIQKILKSVHGLKI